MPVSIVPYIISGEEVADHTHTFPVYSHEDPQVVLHEFSYLPATHSNIASVATNAKNGFKQWSAVPVSKKIEIFTRYKTILQEHRQEFIEVHKEIGGPDWFANLNIDGIIGQVQEYTGHLGNAEGEMFHSEGNEFALTVRQAVGPVLAISPWNAPVLLGGRSILAPLAAGCSVIAKSPERAPRALYLLVKYLFEAGVPKDVVQLVHLKPEDNPGFIDQILATEAIKKINFTGSTAVGRSISVAAAKHVVPCLLELGGKNVSIVTKDADIAKAAGKDNWAAWAHRGQICMSTDHVYVDASVYDEYKEELVKAATEAIKDPDHLIFERDPIGRSKVIALVDDALAKGASLVFGDYSKDAKDDSKPLTPLILENVTPEMKFFDTESFGPIFAIEKFTSLDTLVDKINDTEYGLKTAIWSKNIISAINLAKRIECGGVHINNFTIHDEPHLPHGGVKTSGVGRFNGRWGIESFLYVKTITVDY
ncbi:Vanillin dehydrogenase [Candida viswanathii]|uniref:Vanillin dehydrogenase n=1 Tax=Candida viswanathii TaxID=5486 RepID=A0A367XTN0_9ASCO|nr:Vanillin dehydrogenase [Candida viswanathii]